MNMALQKFAHGATHYCKFKRTALCENALHYDNKTTINKQILFGFQKYFFQRSENWNTPFYLQMFCALSGRSLSWNTPVFSRFTSREHAKLYRLPFFHIHVFPRHSKVQLLKYWGERSFLGIVKSWKVTLKFGRHVENLGDVIIYSVLVEARTGDGYALTFPGYSTITFFFFWMIYYVTFIFSYVQLHDYVELGK